MRFFLRPWFLLVLILIVAGAMRLVRIGAPSMWLDEMLAMENSTGRGQEHMVLPRGVVLDPAPALTRLSDGPGIFRIWTSLERETHPPLYFMALNLWRHVVGESDVAARLFSAAMSLLSIVLMYHIAKLLHGTTPALWACLIMMVAGPQIQFSQDARPYTMLLSLLLAAALAVVRIEKFGPSAWRTVGLGAAVLGMLLTHYLSGAAIAGLGLYAIIRLRGHARRDVIIAFAVAGLVFCLAWGPFLLQQKSRFWAEHAWMREGGDTALTLGHFGRTLLRVSSLPIRWFFEPMRKEQDQAVNVSQFACVLYILPLLLLRQRRDLLLWCLLMIAPVVGVASSDIARGAWATVQIRYSFLATAPVYALIAALLAHQSGWMRHVLPMVVFVSCIGALERAYWRPLADWRVPARVLQSHVSDDDIVLFTTFGERDWQSSGLYLMMSHYAPLSVPTALVEDAPTGELSRRINEAQHVWIVSRRFEPPYQELLPGCTVKRIFPDPECGTIAEIAMPAPARSSFSSTAPASP